jgi:hypothetical protein
MRELGLGRRGKLAMFATLTRALIASTVVSFAGAQTIVRSIAGVAGDQLGRSVDYAGDYNSDGYPDLIVGCPGDSALAADAGSVRIISGKYLALGIGPSTLATRYGINGEPTFGWSVLNVGDLNGDSRPEFLVGQPGADQYSQTTFTVYPDEGQVTLLNGAIGLNWMDTYVGSIVAANTSMQLGWSLAYLGDWDHDGKVEVAVSAPFYDGGLTARGRVYILEASAVNGLVFESTLTGATDTEEFGYSLAAANFGVYSGVSNVRELVVGCPGYDLFSTDQGRVQIYGRITTQTTPQLATSYSGDASSRFGQCVDAWADINGDGYNELVVGEPYADTPSGAGSGRVYVFNGSSLLPNAWFQSFKFDGASADDRFGTSARGVQDVNGDGVRDIVIGAPNIDGILPSDNYGRVYAYSGDTGTLLESQGGFMHQRLGGVIGPALDFDGNGIAEWVACGPDSYNIATNAGVLDVISTFPATPVVYCTGKTNSLGCVPALGYSGAPSASSASAFTLTTSQLLNHRSGLSFYGFRPLAIPFQGGTMCVTTPSLRLPIADSGGSALPANDCSGVLAYDFNARIQSAVDPLLTAGQEVFLQSWARDSASASTTSLSNAIRFVIAP